MAKTCDKCGAPSKYGKIHKTNQGNLCSWCKKEVGAKKLKGSSIKGNNINDSFINLGDFFKF
jgi:hypothetical protein